MNRNQTITLFVGGGQVWSCSRAETFSLSFSLNVLLFLGGGGCGFSDLGCGFPLPKLLVLVCYCFFPVVCFVSLQFANKAPYVEISTPRAARMHIASY